jgi:hypothetical protein
MLVAVLPEPIHDIGVLLVILATASGMLGAALAFFRRVLIRAIDERIAPIHKRIDEHMHTEDLALMRVVTALEIIADHVGVTLPRTTR